MKRRINVLVVIVSLVGTIFTTELFASHSAGSNLTYTCLGGNLYEIEVGFYRDCAGIAAHSNVTVAYSSDQCGIYGTVVLNPIPGTGQEITVPCPSAPSTCAGGTQPGLQEWVYRNTVTIPDTCMDWTFSYSLCCRNNAITNLVQPGNRDIYVESHMDNQTVQCNSSPIFTNPPIAFVCLNQSFTYNHGVIDIDGDSLAYSLAAPLHDSVTAIPYIPPYSFTNPLASVPALSIDPITGDIVMNPQIQEVTVITVLVEEFRNGQLIGSIRRDIQIWVINCQGNNLPTASGMNGTNVFSVSVCPDEPLCFDIFSNDIDVGQNITMTWNSGIPGGTFSITGGSAPTGTFCWTPSFNDVSLIPHAFTVTVQDDACPINGIQTYSYNITVPSPFFTIQTTDLNCPGDANGTAMAVPVFGNPPYQYQWSTGTTGNMISGLTQGAYAITALDTSGCTVTTSFSINAPNGMQSSVNIVDAGCAGSCDGSVMLTVTAGVPPYTYAWSNGSTDASLTQACTGTYSVTITDDNGCTISQTANVGGSVAITVVTNVTDVTCFGGSNGVVTLAGSGGGQPPYTFAWSNGANGGLLNNVPAGTYTVTVTDENNCSATGTAVVGQPDSISTNLAVTDVGCNGAADGAIDLTISGGSAPYGVSWSNGANTEDISGLSGGTYMVTIVDANGCPAVTASATVNEPAALSVTATVSDAGCAGSCDGAIDITITGGAAPFTFTWSNGANTEDLSLLCIGSYSVTVTDANGCTGTYNANVSGSSAITIVMNVTDVTCYGGVDGAVNLAGSGGGSPPYSFNWSNGATTQNIVGLAAGSYSVTVTDENQCSEVGTVMVLQPDSIDISSVVTRINCNGQNNGSIDLTVTGGTPAYSYAWSTGATTQDVSGLTAGTYTVTVTDAVGCNNSTSIDVTEPSALSVSATVIDAGCGGVCTGSSSLFVQGGTPPYFYAWSNGATDASQQNLCAGNYNTTVTDGNGCTITYNSTVGGSSAISLTPQVTDVSCYGGTDGAITISGTGGVPPYTFSWSNGATTQSVINLSAGTYSVTVSDENQCPESLIITVNQPDSLALSATATDVSCNGGADGSISLSVSGGTAPYSYNWSNSATTANIVGLSGGTYTVTVTDGAGCVSIRSWAVNEAAMISIVATVVDAGCGGACTGSVDLLVSGGTAPFSFSWSNGANSEDLTALCFGTYTVTVTDDNNCTATYTAAVGGSSAIMMTPIVTDVSCNGGNDGAIQLTGSGGSPPYSFNWSNGATTQNISGLTAGTYSVTVSDENQCSETISATVGEPNAIGLSAVVSDVLCTGGNDGDIDLTVTGGTSPYTYQWSTGGTGQDLTGQPAGNYSVTVTDDNGCTGTGSYTIAEPATIVLSATVFDAGCAGACTGSIDLLVSGGTSPFTYAWSDGSNTEDLANLCPGSYTVTVTDANQCTEVYSAIINGSTAIIISSVVTDVSCPGGNDGAIDITVTGGISPFTYQWSNGANTEDLSGLAAGTYTVSVFDENQCTESLTVTVNEPATLVATSSVTDVSCSGGADGVIDLSVTGGTTPYSYAWSTGATTQDLNGLSGGTYGVTVTDANGCTTGIAGIVVVENPALQVAGTVFDAGCDGACTGSADVGVSGGTAPYSYFWSNGATDEDLTALCAGTYDLTVTDANGCTITYTAFVQGSPPIQVNTTTTDVTCNGGNDGAVQLFGTGGISPYTFIWSNGATTQNISGLTAGTYSVTLYDEMQCSATASTTVNEPPAITATFNITDVLCFGGSDGAIDMTVVGGTGPYSYNWSNGSTDEDQTGLIAGTYDVTITDAMNCMGTGSATVMEPAQPINQDIIAIDDTSFCFGEMVVVTASGGFVTYQWSSGQNTQSVTLTLSGTYSVTATDANGCTAVDSVIVNSEPCCLPGGFGPIFTSITTANNTIDADVVWAGKYIVNVDVHVINGALLDLTNVDIAFAEGTGIIFHDSSAIRCNNSVLRPCDDTQTWKGLRFEDTAGGHINESLIKHAWVGADVFSDNSVRISNTEFLNNAVGIRIDNAQQGMLYSEAITGNTFLFNEIHPTYVDTMGVTNASAFGIKLYNAVMDGIVSQNDFVNSVASSQVSRDYYGVYMNSSSAIVSENTFTNMFRAIDVTGESGAMSFENNDIEYTQSTYLAIYAVRISDVTTSPLILQGNNLTYSTTTAGNQTGFYIEDVSGAIVRGNSVSGFSTAMFMASCANGSIAKNEIDDASSYGLNLSNTNNTTVEYNELNDIGYIGVQMVNCVNGIRVRKNTITMNTFTTCAGTVFSVGNGGSYNAATCIIADNCISETLIGSYFTAAANGLALPTIRNNFYYNYTGWGVYNIRFGGDLGSCAQYPAQAGRNSFVSNYLPPFGGALDVASFNSNITVTGNSPNLLVSFPTVVVNTNCNTTSNANCGRQIGNGEIGGRLDGPLTQFEIFREFIEENYPLELHNDNYRLASGWMNALTDLSNYERYHLLKSMLDVLADNEMPTEMQNFFNQVSSNNLLVGNKASWLEYYYLLHEEMPYQARAILNTISPVHLDEEEWVEVEVVKVDLMISGERATALDQGIIDRLKAIDDREGKWAPVARDLVQASRGDHDYKFGSQEGVSLGTEDLNGLQLDEDFVDVFPNPADDEITIRFFTDTELDDTRLRIYDAIGRLHAEHKVLFNSGQTTLDVSKYAGGTYIISIQEGKEVLQHTKFVKY